MADDADKKFEEKIRAEVKLARDHKKSSVSKLWNEKTRAIDTALEDANRELRQDGKPLLSKEQELAFYAEGKIKAEEEIVDELKSAKKKAETDKNQLNPLNFIMQLFNDPIGAILSLPVVGRLMGAAGSWMFNNPKDEKGHSKSFSEVLAETDNQLTANMMSQGLEGRISSADAAAILAASAPVKSEAGESIKPASTDSEKPLDVRAKAKEVAANLRETGKALAAMDENNDGKITSEEFKKHGSDTPFKEDTFIVGVSVAAVTGAYNKGAETLEKLAEVDPKLATEGMLKKAIASVEQLVEKVLPKSSETKLTDEQAKSLESSKLVEGSGPALIRDKDNNLKEISPELLRSTNEIVAKIKAIPDYEKMAEFKDFASLDGKESLSDKELQAMVIAKSATVVKTAAEPKGIITMDNNLTAAELKEPGNVNARLPMAQRIFSRLPG